MTTPAVGPDETHQGAAHVGGPGSVPRPGPVPQDMKDQEMQPQRSDANRSVTMTTSKPGPMEPIGADETSQVEDGSC